MQKAADFLRVPLGNLLGGIDSESSGCAVDSEAELDGLVSQLRTLSKESLQIIAPAIRAAYKIEHENKINKRAAK